LEYYNTAVGRNQNLSKDWKEFSLKDINLSEKGVAEIEVDLGDHLYNIFAVSNYHAGTVKYS